MKILRKAEYAKIFKYNPETGAISLLDDVADVVHHYRNSRPTVRLFETGGNGFEDHPAAIVAWILSGRSWHYDRIVMTIDGNMDNIRLSNLKLLTKAEYAAETGICQLEDVVAEIRALCNLGIGGTMPAPALFEGILAATLKFKRVKRAR